MLSLVLGLGCASVHGQTQAAKGTNSAAQHSNSWAPPESPQRLYGDTWYEFLFHQFNPDHLDGGAWIEQRRQALLDAYVRNPYFKYSFLVTFLLLADMGICAKLAWDLARIKWINAEKLKDVLRHDQQSREAAREAIDRYNEHIEKCNRAIEAQEAGLSLSGRPAGSDEALRAELQETATKLAAVTQERDQHKTQLDATRISVAELSMKVEALSRKGNGHRAADEALATAGDGSPDELVRHINHLQQQLHAEREKNKRLKGG